MKGKIALEEHYGCPEFVATGKRELVNEKYFADVAKHLHNADLRLKIMDRNGIETSILSLAQPGIEEITHPRKGRRNGAADE